MISIIARPSRGNKCPRYNGKVFRTKNQKAIKSLPINVNNFHHPLAKIYSSTDRSFKTIYRSPM